MVMVINFSRIPKLDPVKQVSMQVILSPYT